MNVEEVTTIFHSLVAFKNAKRFTLFSPSLIRPSGLPPTQLVDMEMCVDGIDNKEHLCDSADVSTDETPYNRMRRV